MSLETIDLEHSPEVQVDILLSTYNGEKYLAEQIKSVLGQTYQHFKLMIRDDGSTDQTVAIIKEEQKKDSRIHFLEKDSCNLGPAMSFMKLLQYSTSPFVMFCDQDDVWHDHKVELSMATIHEQNQKEPCLVHSDLEVVSEDLSLISSSYITRTNLPKVSVFADLLVQNNVTGCTVLFNASLRKLALQSIPSYMTMHDGWLALLASLYGRVVTIDKPLIQYRQHTENAVGSRNFIEKLLSRMKSPKKMLDLYKAPELQARELDNLRKLANGFVPHQKEAGELAEFLSYCDGGVLKRFSFFFNAKYRKQPALRNLLYRLLFVLLAFFKRKKT